MKPYYVFLLLLLFSGKSFAQNFLGISSSNYGGIHGVLLNPANAVDSRYKLHINLAAAGVEIQNNYARWNAPFSLLSLTAGTVAQKYRSPTTGLPLWKAEYYKRTGVKKVKAYINSEVRGPAIQFSSPRFGIGVAAGVRFRLLNSFGNTSPNMGTAILTGTKNPILHSTNFEDETFMLNVGAYNEIYLSLAKVIREENEDFLKVGFTVKRITSNLNLNLRGDEVDYLIDPIPPSNEYQNIEVAKTSGTFFHASGNTPPSFSWMLDHMTSLSGVGNGFGADIGFVYEKRPNYSRERFKYKGSYVPDPRINKYAYKFGVSLQDIGFVKFADPQNVKVGTVESTDDFIPPATFYQLSSTDELISDIEEVYDIDQSTYLRSFRVFMPATLVIHGDYLVREGFYVSGVLRQYVLGKKKIGPVGFSGISVIPRFERKHIEFSFPVSLDQDYSNLNLGATMRAGPLFLGFDNITGLINLGKPRGLSIHAGLSWGFAHKLAENAMLDCPEPQRTKRSFSLKGLFNKRK
ncbi:DUF5723 family protein [uncultured Arcticibacterium sp.]|uniref:DUF5723 family protein n=1 Tax=uncultured Arcticibacterium sp. TaxID=2173042 RepID=UPI0030F954C4